MKKHIKLYVAGRVQGVGFRFSCMEAAYKYQVKGFVKNRSDHRVYIEAEGEEEDLEKFRQWCHRGPVWARIREVKEEPGELQGFESFEIVH